MERSANNDTPVPQWTRHQVAEHLGVSIATVRRMEGRVLHPAIDPRGVRLFELTEVRVVREERERQPVTKRDDAGEVAARVFALFKTGADLRKAVITARVHPRVVRDLYAEWLVSLAEGEQRRRTESLDRDDRRERTRAEREQKAWARGF